MKFFPFQWDTLVLICGQKFIQNRSISYGSELFTLFKFSAKIQDGRQKWRKLNFIALIHPIQWTIAYPVGADRPAKRQKKTSCVSTGQAGPVLCTRQMACRTSFLSRQRDVIASFSFGACVLCTDFQSKESFQKYLIILSTVTFIFITFVQECV